MLKSECFVFISFFMMSRLYVKNSETLFLFDKYWSYRKNFIPKIILFFWFYSPMRYEDIHLRAFPVILYPLSSLVIMVGRSTVSKAALWSSIRTTVMLFCCISIWISLTILISAVSQEWYFLYPDCVTVCRLFSCRW